MYLPQNLRKQQNLHTIIKTREAGILGIYVICEALGMINSVGNNSNNLPMPKRARSRRPGLNKRVEFIEQK